MNRRAFVLVELLVASSLMSIAATGLYAGLSQAVKMDRVVRNTAALYDPFKILWLRAAKDLRNALPLRDYKFKGKQDEMIFPSLDGPDQIIRVRYFVKEGNLVRSEEKLPEKFVKISLRQSVLLKGVERIKFEYAYLDEEERLVFEPAWGEEPYFGIPRAVRLEIKLKDVGNIFFRLISIPQGRWGHVPEERSRA